MAGKGQSDWGREFTNTHENAGQMGKVRREVNTQFRRGKGGRNQSCETIFEVLAN